MAINAFSLKCPECGASISIEEGRESVFCSYCGAKVYVKNDNEYIYRHIDEAGVKQAETDRLLRLRELEIEERSKSQNEQLRTMLFYVWLVAIAIIALVCLYLGLFGDSGSGLNVMLIVMYIGFPVVGGGAYVLFKLIPDREEDKVVRANGGVRFPKDLGTFSEQHYETIEHALRTAGFTNISCINLHDLTLGLLTKPGKVEKVTVNGKEIRSGGRYYEPDTPITISYHGR